MRSSSWTLWSCLVLTACAGGPSGRDAATANLPVETCIIDPIHSTVVFDISHLNTSHFVGRFNEVKGKYTFDPANLARCSVEVTIPVASLDTGNRDRDTHLLNADFFDSTKYAELKFRSRSVTLRKRGGYQITGDITLHGVTKPISVQADYIGSVEDEKYGNRSGYQVKFKILRSEFGLTAAAGTLGEEVSVLANIEGIRQ